MRKLVVLFKSAIWRERTDSKTESVIGQKLPAFIDGTFVLSALGAILYFLGVADLAGTSNALAFSPSLLAEDVQSMIATGAKSIWLILSSPLLQFLGIFVDWWGLFLASLGPAALFFGAVFWRKLPFRSYTIVTTGLILAYQFVYELSFQITKHQVASQMSCLNEGSCLQADVNGAKKFTISVLPDISSEIVGYLFSAGPSYWILITIDGPSVFPSASVRAMEPVPRIKKSPP